MTDRLPAPLASASDPALVERASATPARLAKRPREPSRRGAVDGVVPRSLHDVECWMIRAITGSESEADRAPAVVTDGPRMTARERLEIYRFGYRARLVECLLDDYPVLAETLGETPFEKLCEAYIERFPSSSPSLNYFGRHMARHCSESTIVGFETKSRFFAELAALEWAIVEVIHAESAPPLDGAALAKLRPEDFATAHFVRSDAVRLFRFEHPVNAYFQARRVGKTDVPIPDPKASATVVYRHGLTVWRMDLTPAMTRVLSALLDGASILDALGKMGVDETDAAAIAEAERSVMVWFREWVSSGLFARLVVA